MYLFSLLLPCARPFLPPRVKNVDPQGRSYPPSVWLGPRPALPPAGTSCGWSHGLPLKLRSGQVSRDVLGRPLESAFLLPPGGPLGLAPLHRAALVTGLRGLVSAPATMCFSNWGPHSPHEAWFREAVWSQ